MAMYRVADRAKEEVAGSPSWSHGVRRSPVDRARNASTGSGR